MYLPVGFGLQGSPAKLSHPEHRLEMDPLNSNEDDVLSFRRLFWSRSRSWRSRPGAPGSLLKQPAQQARDRQRIRLTHTISRSLSLSHAGAPTARVKCDRTKPELAPSWHTPRQTWSSSAREFCRNWPDFGWTSKADSRRLRPGSHRTRPTSGQRFAHRAAPGRKSTEFDRTRQTGKRSPNKSNATAAPQVDWRPLLELWGAKPIFRTILILGKLLGQDRSEISEDCSNIHKQGENRVETKSPAIARKEPETDIFGISPKPRAQGGSRCELWPPDSDLDDEDMARRGGSRCESWPPRIGGHEKLRPDASSLIQLRAFGNWTGGPAPNSTARSSPPWRSRQRRRRGLRRRRPWRGRLQLGWPIELAL